MPLYKQRDIKEIEAVLNKVLDIHCSPVARCRLLSTGFGPHHALKLSEDISGTVACLGCGNCIDICPVLAREPNRLEKTAQRTSMALETLVARIVTAASTARWFARRWIPPSSITS